MKTRFLLLAVTTAALAANSASARTEHPRISMQAARASALALVPHGAIRSGELEREHGRLIYSFDIAVPNQTGIEEVQINAMTGRLVSRTHENPAAERQEVRAEAREHAPH
jgi:uncharacterized membrane protein YkoI